MQLFPGSQIVGGGGERRTRKIKVRAFSIPADLTFSEPGETRGVLLGILGGGVPTGSPNPDPIKDQIMSFSTPVFTLGQ